MIYAFGFFPCLCTSTVGSQTPLAIQTVNYGKILTRGYLLSTLGFLPDEAALGGKVGPPHSEIHTVP